MGESAERRVFCVGMNKTGTSSIKRCFEILHITPIASPKTYGQMERRAIHRFYQDRNYGEILKLAENYTAFEDRPWNMWSMFRHLDQHYPDSRFILTTRDPESWWRSVERWVTVTKPEVLSRYQMHLMVSEFNQQSVTESYLRYNSEVKNYFRGTDKLLQINFVAGEGWKKLCGFLGVPVPAAEFPHRNRQRYTGAAEGIQERKHARKGRLHCQRCASLAGGKQSQESMAQRHSNFGKLKTLLRRSRALRDLRQSAFGRITHLSPGNLQGSYIARAIAFQVHRLFFKTKITANLRNAPRVVDSPGSLSENEFAVVSCFFNPSGSSARVINFQRFLAGVKASGVRCLVVELALGSAPFRFGAHEDLIQIRSNDVLWHKESLLNIGIRKLLSDGVRKIAWLDGDIVFADALWAHEISQRLDSANLCQVFSTVAIQAHSSGPPMIAPSSIKHFKETGEFFSQNPMRASNLLRGMLKGGQSGFGWAATAEVLKKVLLFEHAVVGGGDKLILAASLTSDLSDERLAALTRSRKACGVCGYRNLSEAFTESFAEWAEDWSTAVGGSVDYARLDISDMFHGRRTDRGYMSRHDILYRNRFNPSSDLTRAADGSLAWAAGREKIKSEVETYFLSRRED